MSTTSRSAAGLAAVLAAAALLAAPPVQVSRSQGAAAVGPPNVVVILVDDGRVADMSTLPRIRQRIGSAGATFTGTISSFPLCCPARATLLTGQYPHNHKVLSNGTPLGGWAKFKDANTLATWLDPAYRTGLVGKYFNQYRTPYVPPGWDYWAAPKGMYNYTSPAWSVNGADQTFPGYRTDTMGTLSADFITDSAAADQPFFLYTSIVAPHDGLPNEADDPPFPNPSVKPVYRDRFAGLTIPDPSFNEADVSDKPVRPARLTNREIAGLVEVNAQRREALLSAQDAVDTIIDALAATGELANTYVWFLSDNGFLIGEHRIRSGKALPYEPSLRVPMLLRGPGIAPHTVVRQPTALVDFAPTVLAMTGRLAAQGPFPMDGTNLLPMIRNPQLNTARPIVIEAGPASDQSPDTAPYRYHGIVDHHWKYVVRIGGQKELYNLTKDPYELTNLAGTPANAATQSRLQALLQRYQWCRGAACR